MRRARSSASFLPEFYALFMNVTSFPDIRST